MFQLRLVIRFCRCRRWCHMVRHAVCLCGGCGLDLWLRSGLSPADLCACFRCLSVHYHCADAFVAPGEGAAFGPAMENECPRGQTMRKGAGPVLICAALGIAFLCGLGVWQVKRLAWKTALIAQLSERMSAKPIPLADALARMKSGEDIEYLRVAVDAPAGPHKVLLKQTVINGLAAWEGISGFHSTDGANVLVDLGASETGTAEVSGPTHFEAILRKNN